MLFMKYFKLFDNNRNLDCFWHMVWLYLLLHIWVTGCTPHLSSQWAYFLWIIFFSHLLLYELVIVFHQNHIRGISVPRQERRSLYIWKVFYRFCCVVGCSHLLKIQIILHSETILILEKAAIFSAPLCIDLSAKCL